MAGKLGKQSQSAAASYAAAQDEAVRYMRVPVRVPPCVSGSMLPLPTAAAACVSCALCMYTQMPPSSPGCNRILTLFLPPSLLPPSPRNAASQSVRSSPERSMP